MQTTMTQATSRVSLKDAQTPANTWSLDNGHTEATMLTNALRPLKQTGAQLRSNTHFAKPAAHAHSYQTDRVRPATQAKETTNTPQTWEVAP